MKKYLLIISLIIAALLLTVSVTAENSQLPSNSSEFVIAEGVLQKYTGSEIVVTIPDGVTNIAAGAFTEAASVTTVIINSTECDFEAGAFGESVIINAPADSKASLAAVRDNLTFVPFSTPEKTVKLTIYYNFSMGISASPMYSAELKVGDYYSVPSPVIEGYTASIETVEGVAGESDIAVTVIYSESLADGWSIESGKAKYVKNGRFLVDTTEEIDGIPYNFDENGFLMIASGFLNIGESTYYFRNSTAVTGYNIIANHIYYFNSDGTMLKGRTHGSFEFDINGHMLGSNLIVTVDGKSYYLLGNELSSGFKNINGDIKYFGDDYVMVTNRTLDGYTFDKDGVLIAGISISELEISKISDVSYSGTPLKPSVTVKFKGILLSENVHYTLSYSGNNAPGTGKVTIQGIGIVSGSTDVYFTILGENALTLTIKYVNVMGSPVASTYVTQIEPGSSFNIPSPEVEGMRPDQDSISGVMGDESVTYTVTYTRVHETSDTGSSDETTDPAESTSQTITEETTEITGYKYDYALLVKVFVVATLVTGITIVLILNWDLIKKKLSRKAK